MGAGVGGSGRSNCARVPFWTTGDALYTTVAFRGSHGAPNSANAATETKNPDS